MIKYDKKIADLNSEQMGLERQMDALAAKFCDLAAGFLSSWYESQARNEVKRNAEVTAKLGGDQIAVLKQKVRDLQKNVKTIVANFLGNNSIWWHKSHGEQQYYYYGNRPPDIVDKALRLAAGRLGTILEEFEYFSKDNPGQRLWRELGGSGSYLPNARPYYPYGMDWTPQKKDIMVEYDEAHTRCKRIAEEIAQIEKQKREKQAEDLWDSV